ncbi:Glycosyltransferase family 9 [anaerobic digester metagenome]
MSRKILIIRFSSIGDIVLTSPVIRAIKKQLTAPEVHFLTKKSFIPVLEHNPYLDSIIGIDHRVSEVKQTLLAAKYDFVIDLHHNIRSWQVTRLLHTRYSRFPKLNRQKWLKVHFHNYKMPDNHIVDRYFEAAAPLGIKKDGEGLELFLPGHMHNLPAIIPPEYKDRYVGLVIGGKHNTKILPVEKVIDVIQRLNYPVILLGGKEDFQRGEAIADACNGKAWNACGKFSLLESALLVKHASAIISNDTGLMHIAAAFNKPIVSVWGNTIPEFGMYPYLTGNTPHFMAEIKPLYCRPCSKIGFEKCPQKHFRCMLEQDTANIAATVNQWLPE